MNTLAFGADGRCMCAVNDFIESENFPEAAIVLHTEQTLTANQVWYDIANEVLVLRRPIQVGVSPNMVVGVPAGTTAIVGTDEIPVDDGSIELEVDYPQTVKLVLLNPRFLDTVVEVPCEVQG
jgi:hypothetical protein